MSLLEAPERAGFYGFLATALSAPPTHDSVWGICQMAAAFGFSPPDGFSLKDLSREYLELFVVLNPRFVAPYESVFRDCLNGNVGERDGLAGATADTVTAVSGSALDIRQYHLEAGLASNEQMADHIGSELRFMADLWWRQESASASEARRLASIRARFRNGHLLQWIDRLSKKVAENDRLGYYTTALKVVEAVVEDDT